MDAAACRGIALVVIAALERAAKAISSATPGYLAGTITVELHPAVFHAVRSGLLRDEIEREDFDEVRLWNVNAVIRRGKP